MANIPLCRVNRKDFEEFRSAMRELVGWPVPFKWNEEGHAWITGPKLDGWQKAILNQRFPVINQIANNLNEIRKKPDAVFRGNVGFYVMDDCIMQKSPFRCIAKLQCLDDI